MTEKRFRIVNELGDYHIKDGDDELCYDLCSPSMAKENWNNVVNRLNELVEENQQYKLLLQDMGLLMSDEDVMCIRSEIADKFIKPLCKENGFDVDVDCTNGFTIIPKGDVE